jgi:hypothetical protein
VLIAVAAAEILTPLVIVEPLIVKVLLVMVPVTVPVTAGQALAQFAVPTSTHVPAAVSVWNFFRYSL